MDTQTFPTFLPSFEKEESVHLGHEFKSDLLRLEGIDTRTKNDVVDEANITEHKSPPSRWPVLS